uniref:Acyl_transf_3 domain-containing protein n=2 Tax=Caenorhabditis tropicalis TaxID=1561998 RepID=A0A1I7UKD3_9PELO
MFQANPPIEVLKRPVTWMMFYFHRWIRLTSALMVFIGFFDAYGKYIQGPYDALTGYSMVTQTDQCDYWSDILHISNFKSVDKMCYLPAWHLAVDLQFTLVAPMFLMFFYYSALIGTTIAIIASFVGSALTIYFYLHNDMLHSAFTGNHEYHFIFLLCFTFVFRVDDKLVEIILSKPWNQLAPYMIGMIVGYFLAIYHGSRKIMHPVASSVIWILVTVIGISALLFGNSGTSQLTNALTNVLTRASWCLCLVWIIVSSEMKWAGPIGHFLEHPFWRPFGKLSYCAFIVHHMALYFLFNMEEKAPRYISFWHEYFQYTIPIVVYSYFVAFFLSMFVEVPMIRLDKMILDRCLPASKIKEHEELDDYDDSDIEKDDRENSNDDSERGQSKSRSEERSIEDQNEEKSEEDKPMLLNSPEELLLNDEYY